MKGVPTDNPDLPTEPEELSVNGRKKFEAGSIKYCISPDLSRTSGKWVD